MLIIYLAPLDFSFIVVLIAGFLLCLLLKSLETLSVSLFTSSETSQGFGSFLSSVFSSCSSSSSIEVNTSYGASNALFLLNNDTNLDNLFFGLYSPSIVPKLFSFDF